MVGRGEIGMSATYQPGILAPGAPYGRSLSFSIRPEIDPTPALLRLRQVFDPDWGVVGIGEPLAKALWHEIPGLRPFPALSSAHAIPSIQHALWIFLRAGNRGDIFDLSQKVIGFLSPEFEVSDSIETFSYAGGRDLTGYIDGTANPDAQDSPGIALVKGESGAQYSSYVAVQRWTHDLPHFHSHSQTERDTIMGRRLDDNEEIADAPESAHVKRTAQELFDPTAFMVRRSQPWASEHEQGLEFIAYCASLDPFERMMKRMAGVEDGLSDALFTFSRPVNGAYYWCPPLLDNRLDLVLLGL
jgi:putative iron-dependent peroxidase